jgi:hypothetical protein
MTQPEQPDLPNQHRSQRRRIVAAERRTAARARFDALPEEERTAIWARIDRLLFVEAVWRVARTMPENPHSYTRRRDWKNDTDFVFVVQFLRSGICDREKFAGRWYDVLNRHGRKVWVMGWPLNYSNGKWCTVLLNKKPVEANDL